MTVRVSKPEFNLREKLTELDKPTGLKGNELLRSETTQDARDLVSAGRRNMVINGDMRINQRGSSSHTLNSGNVNAYVVDRFRVQCAEGTLVASQDNDVPPRQGFVKSIKLDCTGADTSLAAGFESYIQYLPEAQDLVHLAYGNSGAKTVTFSFWVKSNLNKTFGFYYYVPDATRAYQTTFNINSANTWEKKVITIPGDTAGNGFNNDNGVGAELRIYLASGTTLDGNNNQNQWGANTTNRIPSGTSILSSTDNNFYFTGFQMEVGENATEFEHRSFGEELARCQRYFYKIQGESGSRVGIGGCCVNSIEFRMNVTFPVTMRALPTISGTGTAQMDAATDSANFNCSNITIESAPTGLIHSLGLQAVTSGMVGGQGGNLRFRSNGSSLSFSAEL